MATGGSAAESLTSQNKNEALTCALCLDIYRQPKLLPCFHTYCLKCVEDLVDQARSKDDSTGDRDEEEPLKKHEKVVAAVEAEDAETTSEKSADSVSGFEEDQKSDIASENVSFAAGEMIAHGEGTESREAADVEKPAINAEEGRERSELNPIADHSTAQFVSAEDQNQTDKCTKINDSIEEEINIQIPLSADDPENEKNLDTIGSLPGGDDLGETRAELTDSGVKREEIATASTTSGYTSPSGEDELASEVFSAEGVSQVDPQASELVDISETVAEKIQKPTKRFFLCPSCREQIKVPESGASAFQNNVYIREDELERAKEETQGLTHSCKTYDLFCVECDVLICVNCKLSEHLHHKSLTLADAAASAKAQLYEDKDRLKASREGLEKNAEERETDRQQFADKKDLVEKEIRQRRSTIVAAADKYCDEALKTLDNTFTTTTTKDSKALDEVNKNITVICGLEERMQNAETSNDQCELVLVAKEMRSGNGSRQVVDRLASLPRLSEISRPVLRSSAERDDVGKMFTTMEKFIGTTEYVTMKTAEPEVSAEMIQCEDVTPNAEFFCICLIKSGLSLYLSFTPSCECQGPLQVLSDTGNTIIRDEYDGKVESYTSRRDINEFIYQGNKEDCVDLLYVKSHTEQIFLLETSGGNFSIKTYTVVSADPFKTKTEKVFEVTSYGNIQAFDMNDQEQLAAVIFEDSKTKARQVRLFRRPQYGGTIVQAVATYTPPMATSVLADVCFFTLKEQEVLLIADAANDAIHVVEVKDDKMTFSRFLCPGCPLLLQPTALNTDSDGRLWVGCRGGRLVNFQPAVCDDDDDDMMVF